MHFFLFALFMFISLLPQPAPAQLPEGPLAYVTNEKDNSVSVVDVRNGKVVLTAPVGRRPRGIILSQDKKHIYICASDDDRVEIRDADTLALVRYLPSGPDPELFILHPDGRTLFIANEDDNMVTVVDVPDQVVIEEIPVGVEPEGMGLAPLGDILVNTSETTNMAHFIDTDSLEIIHNTLVDARPRVSLYNKEGTEVWVSSEVGGTVSVIDPTTYEIQHIIRFQIAGVTEDAIQPVGVRLTDDGRYAFIALGPANRVAVVDQKTKEVITYLLVGQRVWQLAFTPDQKWLVTTNGVSNDVSIIDVGELEVTRSVGVGRFPGALLSARTMSAAPLDIRALHYAYGKHPAFRIMSAAPLR